MSAVQRVEAAFGHACAHHPPGAHRLAEALEGVRAKVGELEQAAEQAARARRDHDAARLGQGLQAGRQIRRLAHNRLFLRRPLADQVADHHPAGGDPDPGAELSTSGRQISDLSSDREASPNGALGIVLMGFGVAEIGEHAVAHELGDVALEACDLGRDGVLIGADDLAHLFGIQPRRQLGRADQVAEHHSQLSPLGFGCRRQRPACASSRGRFVGQRRATAAAESRGRRIGEAAGGTRRGHLRAALDAESPSFGHRTAAARANHDIFL